MKRILVLMLWMASVVLVYAQENRIEVEAGSAESLLSAISEANSRNDKPSQTGFISSFPMALTISESGC